MIWKYIFTMFSVTLAQTNNGKGNAYAYGKGMSGSSGSSGMLADFLSSLTTTLSTLSSTTLSTLSSTTLSTLSSTTLSTLSSTTLSTLSSTTLSSIGNDLSVFDESKSDQNATGRETTFPLSYVLGATTLLAISSILTFLLIKHKKKESRIEELYVYHDNNTDPLETYQSNSNYLQPQISEENFQNNYYSEAGNECVELYCLASSIDSETYDNSSFYDIWRE
jgi:hypothetical protein